MFCTICKKSQCENSDLHIYSHIDDNMVVYWQYNQPISTCIYYSSETLQRLSDIPQVKVCDVNDMYIRIIADNEFVMKNILKDFQMYGSMR